MATPLANLQQTVKDSSGLYTSSAEELSNQQGMAGPLTTPLGGAGIGASPDSAKMLGTAPNKLNAIRQAARGQADLATSQREEQARKTATAAEQAKRQRENELSGLSGMQGRVQEIADKMFAGDTAGTVINQLAVSADKIKATVTDPTKVPRATDLLTKVGQNSATNADLIELGQIFGYTNINDLPALKKQLMGEFMPASQQAAGFVSDQVADTIQLNALSNDQWAKLGFRGPEEAAAALQIDPGALAEMKVQDLQAYMQKEGREDYGQVQKLQQVLNDPARSATEKAQALKVLREKGAVGITATEQDYSNLQKQVDKADTVQFMGQSYTIDKLLDNNNIQGFVKAYFDDPSAAALLKKTQPAFADWIERNKAVLEGASRAVDKRFEGFAAVNLKNLAKAKTDGGNISDATMKSIFGPGWGSMQPEEYDTPAAIKAANDPGLPADVKAGIVNMLNDVSTAAPEMSYDLASTGYPAFVAAGMNSPTGLAKYTSTVKTIKALEKAPPDQVFAIAFPNIPSADLAALIQKGKNINALNLGGKVDDELIKLMDADGDGLMDDPADVRNRFVTRFGGGSGPLTIGKVAEIPGGASGLWDSGKAANTAKAAVEHAGGLVEKVKNWLTPDAAEIDPNKIDDLIANGGLSFDELRQVATSGAVKSSGASDKLATALSKMAGEQANNALSAAGISPDTLKDWAGKTSGGEQLAPEQAAQVDKAIADLEDKLNKAGGDSSAQGQPIRALLNQLYDVRNAGAAVAERQRKEQEANAERERQAKSRQQQTNIGRAETALATGGMSEYAGGYSAASDALYRNTGIQLPGAQGASGLNTKTQGVNQTVGQGTQDTMQSVADIAKTAGNLGSDVSKGLTRSKNSRVI